MKLAHRVAAATAVAAVVAGLLGWFVLGAVHRSEHAVDQTLTKWSTAAVGVQALLAHVVDQETGERGFVITGDPNYLQPYHAGAAATALDIGSLSQLTRGATDVRAALGAVDGQLAKWHTRAAEPEIAARGTSATAAARLVETNSGKAMFDVLRTDIARLQDLIEAHRVAALAGVRRADTDLVRALVAATAGLALLVAATLLGLDRWVLRPLGQLSAALRRVSGGELGAEVSLTGPPDFELVAADAEAMRRRIVEELADSERSRQALEQQGHVVLHLSDYLTARAPEPIPGLRYSSRLQPAEGVLAGDWIDVLRLGPGRVGLVLVDVSGHGAAAGLEALRLKHVLTTALTAGLAPHQALAQAAAGFTDDERFATGVIIDIEVASGKLRWANAGHLAPLIVSVDAPVIEPADVRELDASGPIMSSLTRGWVTRQGRLEVDEMLLTFSDGLTEARDPRGRQFGPDGVCAALSQTTIRDVDTAIRACLAAVRAFSSGPNRDDITIMAVTRDPLTVEPVGSRPVQTSGSRQVR
jgi:sigma-B regulation protein RsbU (phosphoserine phosphatase)